MKKYIILLSILLLTLGCRTIPLKPAVIGVSPDGDMNAFKQQAQGDIAALKGDISLLKGNIDKLLEANIQLTGALSAALTANVNANANVGVGNTSTNQTAQRDIVSKSKVNNESGIMKNYIWAGVSILLIIIIAFIFLIGKIFNLMKRKEYYKEQAYVRAKPSEYEKIRKMHDLYIHKVGVKK